MVSAVSTNLFKHFFMSAFVFSFEGGGGDGDSVRCSCFGYGRGKFTGLCICCFLCNSVLVLFGPFTSHQIGYQKRYPSMVAVHCKSHLKLPHVHSTVAVFPLLNLVGT